MRSSVKGFVGAIVAAGACGVWAAAHDAIRGLNGKPILWKAPAVAFTLHPSGSDDVPDDSELLAIRLAFEEWNQALEGKLVFTESKANAESLDVDDFKTHRVVFDENDVTGYFPPGTGIVAVTPIRHTADNKILDADVVFNGRDQRFSTNLTPGTFDVRDVATHEIGHFAGLDHSPFLSASLFPFVAHAQTLHRSLTEDDRCGARKLYGVNAGGTGRLTGSVALAKPAGGAGKAVSGAHVSVRRDDGRAVTGTFTKVDGTFELAGLAPGHYVVSIAPLDGPMTKASVTSKGTFDSQFGSTVVGSAGVPTAFAVLAGETTSTGLCLVPQAAVPSIQSVASVMPLTVAIGDARWFEMYGSGVFGSSVVSTTGYAVSVPSFTPDVNAEGGTGILTAAPSAQPGVYDLVLSNGAAGSAVEAGAVEAVVAPPLVAAVGPGVGALSGGTGVAISGSGFVAGARVVFGDQIAAVVSTTPNVLEVLTPAFSKVPAGPVDVVVVNPDGQEGRKKGAFTALALLEATSVFPAAASSAGGTILTIVGQGFVPGTAAFARPAGSAAGSVALPVVAQTLQTLTVATPALAPGSYDVAMALPLGTETPGPAEVVLTAALAVVEGPDPSVEDVLPGVVPTSGGTLVRVLGNHLTSAVKVRLGGDPATGEGGIEVSPLTFVSPGEIQWLAPAVPAEGAWTLRVENALGQVSAPATLEFAAASKVAGSAAPATRGGGGPGCGAVWVVPGGPPDPTDQAGAVLSASLALVAAALLAARRARAVDGAWVSREVVRAR